MDPISLEDAAAILGGSAGPLNVKQVERMIAAGLLPVYGRGKGRRTFRQAVEELLQRIASREVTWPPSASKAGAQKAPAVSTKTKTARGRRPIPLTDDTSDAALLTAKPPKSILKLCKR